MLVLGGGGFLMTEVISTPVMARSWSAHASEEELLTYVLFSEVLLAHDVYVCLQKKSSLQMRRVSSGDVTCKS